MQDLNSSPVWTAKGIIGINGRTRNGKSRIDAREGIVIVVEGGEPALHRDNGAASLLYRNMIIEAS